LVELSIKHIVFAQKISSWDLSQFMTTIT